MEKKPISRAGFDNLIKELKDLKEVQRPEILKTVQWARSLGDLSENADYSAAREKQRQIDNRIRFIDFSLITNYRLDSLVTQNLLQAHCTSNGILVRIIVGLNIYLRSCNYLKQPFQCRKLFHIPRLLS